MLDALLKVLVNLTSISLIALHSLAPTLPQAPPFSKAFERESFEMLIEETFIPINCRFIVNYYTDKELLEKMLKASGCDQYYEIRKTIKVIPVFSKFKKGEMHDFDDRCEK
ncbi:MAG: hypothetical protein QW228_09055 [Candidatus Aenigmatarchaeota archaeon]